MVKGNKMGRGVSGRDEKYSLKPQPQQQPNTTVLTDQYLIFNDSFELGHPCMIAILRLYNPSPKGDIFYKLYSDSYRVCFHVKSWKGRVRRNSFVEIVINTNVLPSDVRYSDRYTPAHLTPQQLVQTRFILEINEYAPKWNPHRKSYSNNTNNPNHLHNHNQQHHCHYGQSGGGGGGHQQQQQEQHLKVEFQCATRDSFWRLHRVQRVPQPLLPQPAQPLPKSEVIVHRRSHRSGGGAQHSPVSPTYEPEVKNCHPLSSRETKSGQMVHCTEPMEGQVASSTTTTLNTLLTSLCSTVLCGLLGGVAFLLILRFGYEVEPRAESSAG